MVMPYIEGEDLDHMLKRLGKLSRALILTAQISSILAHAQTNGIAHCDIAPGNIRLDTLGQYRLFDFGLSRATKTDQSAHSLGGTPAYMSPEQIRGDVPDIRSNIYALGIILYEVLAGETPFRASTPEELEGKHLRGESTLPEPLQSDRPLAALIERMLATDCNQRLGSAFELYGILAAMGHPLLEFRSRPSQEYLHLHSEASESVV